MDATVIVAIPAADDYVWKISSEKIPHMTLLYLGDQSNNPKLELITQFVEHVANTSLRRFGVSVDRRGELGDDRADVLFFENSYSVKMLREIRANLLSNDNISEAYNSVEQFPKWTPHLTLGYPETPAKPDRRDYPGISWVNFDRVAIWTGNFEGSEFPLKSDDALEVSMSGTVVENILAHYGVKGMRWGVRKSSGGVSTSKKTTPKSEDFKTAEAAKAKVGRRGNTSALSNNELQAIVRRMNLEKQYKDLAVRDKKNLPGLKFVSDVVTNVGKQQVTRLANDYATQQIGQIMSTAANKKK